MKRQYEQEIALLKRRLNRETKARKLAERMLDDYSQQAFLANETLRKAVATVEEKQLEIEFFVKSTEESTSAESHLTLVESLLELCATFTDASYAACFLSKDGNLTSTPTIIRNKENRVSQLDVTNVLPLSTTHLLSAWCIQEFIPSNSGREPSWLVYCNFHYAENVDGWLVMLIDSQLIDEEKLHALDAHIAQLRHSLDKLNNDKLRKLEMKVIDDLKGQLSTARKQLVVTDRMASLGVLASGVAHEINNPLAFISANNKYLKRALVPAIEGLKKLVVALDGSVFAKLVESNHLLKLEETIIEVLQDNTEGIDRLSKISDSLRTFVHSSVDEHTVIDLNKVVKDVLKVAAFSKKYTKDVSVQTLESPALVNANSREIEQVLLNIVINALHATENHGDVSMAVKDENYAFSIEVKDSGIGIPKENLEKIFSPFYTTKGVGEGTGLGLAISKSIIDAHDGVLKVESTENVGTCFSILLPKASEKQNMGVIQ